MSESQRELSRKACSSVTEFCAEHGISRALFYLLLARGDGPRIMKVGRRTLVTAEAADEWRSRMERQARKEAA